MARKNNIKKRKEAFAALIVSEKEAEEKREKKRLHNLAKKRQREEEIQMFEPDVENIFMADLKTTEIKARRKLKGKRASTKPKESGQEKMQIEKTFTFSAPQQPYNIEMRLPPQELKPLTHMHAAKRRKGPRSANIEN